MKRSITLIITYILLMVFVLCSCGSENINTKPFSAPNNIKSVQSGAVAQNENYNLIWDSNLACLILQNRKTGAINSTIPYEYYQNYSGESDFQSLNLCSPIKLVCANINTSQTTEYFTDTLVSENSIYSMKIKNGIRIIYIFRDISVTVPIDYVLTDRGLKVSVLIDEITEKNELVQTVYIAPFFASVKNDDSSYVFVPDGSGALMYTDEGRDLRNYQGSVYGEDLSDQKLEAPVSTEKIHLPVFGTSSKDGGMLGILEEGSELGVISAVAGDERLKYSTVYAGFKIRAMASSTMTGNGNTTLIVNKASSSKAKLSTASVLYIPMDKEKCSYNDMAAYYRQYLLENKKITEKQEKNGVFLTVLGGVKVKKSFLGIPYQTVEAATTVKETAEIVEDLSKSLDKNITLKLKGFTQGGLDGGKLGGGFKLDGSLGNNKDLEELYKLCKANDIDLIMDFDIVNFDESANGFSPKFDSAQNSNQISFKRNKYSIVIHQISKGADGQTFFLSRALLTDAADKLLKKTEKLSLNGISVDSLGNEAYSDCVDAKYIGKANMDKQVKEILSKIKSKKLVTATQNANLYAANADYIFSSPTATSRYHAFDEEIPFYQMIVKGYTSMATQSVNLSDNPEKVILKAALTGCAVEYTVSNSFIREFITTSQSGVSATTFKDIKNDIADASKLLSEVWDTVAGEQLVAYSASGDLAHSVFSNGAEVYANFSDTDLQSPAGVVKANSFILLKGGN